MMDKKQTLWTRNFKLATSGMVISALAGVGLNIALSVVVFEETQSTLLNSIYLAASFLPNFVLPLVIGPYIDRHNPLKILVRNEIILALLFFIAGVVLNFTRFSYWPFLFASLLISCLGVVSSLASQSLIPQLMDKKFYSKGNAIISTIYPLSNVLVAPIMMILLNKVGLANVLILYSFACLIDVFIESRIDEPFEYLNTSEALSLKTYFNDLQDGLHSLKKDTGLVSVLIFFSIVMFTNGTSSLVYPYFNQSSLLTDQNYAMLLSFQSAGYMFGGFFHYLVTIPDNKRYLVAVIVYFVFSILDGLFFFYPLLVMFGVKFILGFAGMNSANIRTSAVQHRLDNQNRAKINAMFGVSFTLFEVLGQLVAGALGEFFPIKWIHLAFNVLYFAGILVIVLPPKHKIKEMYNYDSSSL